MPVCKRCKGQKTKHHHRDTAGKARHTEASARKTACCFNKGKKTDWWGFLQNKRDLMAMSMIYSVRISSGSWFKQINQEKTRVRHSVSLNTGHLKLSIMALEASQVARRVKNPPANAGDLRDVGSIPGSGRSPGESHGNPLQYSCLDNPMDRGAWWAIVHRVAKSGT